MDPSRDSGAPHFVLNVARLLIGTLFALNGIAKLVGIWGWEPQAAGSLLWWAGSIETVTGICVALGLFTRPMAVLAVLLMFEAYRRMHLPDAIVPAANVNNGERAVLYGTWFLYFAVKGAGAFSLDGLIQARRRSKV